MSTKNSLFTALAGGALAMSSHAGCGSAVTPELESARAVMDEARQSAAARLKPDELLVAERTLERAEAAQDGSALEADLAYVAERQTQRAIVNAHRSQLETTIARNEESYRTGLESLTEEQRQMLRARERALMMQHEVIGEHERALIEREQEIEDTRASLLVEQQARRDAEERARVAMDRLREIAAVRQEADEIVITLRGEVLFATGQAEILPTGRERLMTLAEVIRDTENQTGIIEGHTDSRGADDYNMRLSRRRAEAVRDFLVAQGVPGSRLQAVGLGEAMPIASNDTPEGRANNRRVEVRLRSVELERSE
jgi:outer membrane protein OmpA-like peptidoglycan-associated protein